MAAVCAITLLLGAAAFAADERPERGAWQAPLPPTMADPAPHGTTATSDEDRTRQIEQLVRLEEKDPAGFRDLMRRSLSARLLWAVTGRPLPPDHPVELATP